MGSNLEMTMRELMAESPTYDIQVGECKSLSVMCLVCFQTSQIERVIVKSVLGLSCSRRDKYVCCHVSYAEE